MNKVEEYIRLCDESIDWVAKHKPEQYEQRFLEIVEQRRILKQVAETKHDNPAIAAYGKSQVGKSYLMSILLQDKGRPFIVKSEGKEYNFINDMNPITSKTEATGVVTRFTSFVRCPELFKEEHPIIMRTLSVMDIAIVLAEGYYNDICDYSTPDKIEETAKDCYDKYRNMPKQSHGAFSADDALTMKNYFKKYINNAQEFNKSSFFDRLALVAESIPCKDLAGVFAPLWNNDANLTALMDRFVSLLQHLNFNRYIYLPAGALLHNGNNENTVMSVQCLNGLSNANGPKTDIYLFNGGGFTSVPNLLKSELCGICAEIIIKIPQNLLDSVDSYDFNMIDDTAVANLLTKEEVKKDILKQNDLLDFPGARTRTQEHAAKLSDWEVLTKILLRGKVAYLFNKYSEARMINILLFCHHNENNDVTSIPNLLSRWVEKYIGETPADRANKLNELNGISPLFYIGTMFNIDMKFNHQNEMANRGEALSGRWAARFEKVLMRECFGPSFDWWQDWTGKGSMFQNSYLLRDFKYSGNDFSQLYSGFDVEKKETKIIMTSKDANYFRNMRDSFVESEHVKKLFENPALSWDVATTINNDGSLFIIQRLGMVASLISGFRDNQFAEDVTKAVGLVKRAMADYYVNTDQEVILRENIRKSKTIHRELDFACNHDNYFFGHLLQGLQLRSKDTLNIVHDLMNGNELNQKVQQNNSYEVIFVSCNGFNGCKNIQEKWNRLIQVYGYADLEDAQQDLLRKGVDTEILFSPAFERKKNSYIIAGKVLDRWMSQIQSVEMINRFCGDNTLDNIALGYLTSNLLSTAKSFDIEKILSDCISEFVDITNISTAVEGLVADVITETVNEFVLDLGYKYLDSETKEKVARTVSTDPVLSLDYINRQQPDDVTDDYITGLFDSMSVKPSPLTPAFEDNYFKWKEYILVSFISHLTCQDYDRDANDKLSVILEALK